MDFVAISKDAICVHTRIEAHTTHNPTIFISIIQVNLLGNYRNFLNILG